MSQNSRRFPFDIIGEILLKLDVKTLLSCTTVCKCWNSHITSPYFISRYSYPHPLSNSKNESLLVQIFREDRDSRDGRRELSCTLLRSDNDQLDSLREQEGPPISRFRTKRFSFRLVSSCNGLVCLVDDPDRSFTFLLWNPNARKYALLPRPDSALEYGTLGLGFDRRNKDFKVVKLFAQVERRCMTWVYSLANRAWKSLSDTAPPCSLLNGRIHVCINGALHWLARHSARDDNFVLTLDLAQERFGEISLPQSVSDKSARRGSISVLARGDSLAMSHVKSAGARAPALWCVWVMKEYGVAESWTKIVTVQEQVPRNVFAMRKNGEMIVEINEKILRYNPRTATMEDLRVRRGDNNFIGNLGESLFLLKKIEGVRCYSYT